MSYAIQNRNGDHLGFLLMAGENNNGECIFRSLPGKPELFETEESDLLFHLQEQGEFTWIVTTEGIEITNEATGSSAVISNGVLKIKGFNFNVVDMGAS